MKQENNCALPQEGAFRTTIGGQALIEGILMRGPEKQAIVVRNQEGELEVKEQTLKLIKDRYPILGLPFLRGVVNFLASLVEGVKALMWSAEFYPDEELSLIHILDWDCPALLLVAAPHWPSGGVRPGLWMLRLSPL